MAGVPSSTTPCLSCIPIVRVCYIVDALDYPLQSIRNSVLLSLESNAMQHIPVVWEYGPHSFVNALKTTYFSSSNRSAHRIVYSKRGTTGIAGQMKGVCDTFLLALLHNYSFYCFLYVSDSFLVVPNQLSEDYLQFPFPGMAIHSLNDSALQLIDQGSKPYAGIDYEGSLPSNQSFLLLSNHVFAHKLLRFKSNQETLRRLGISPEMAFTHPSNHQHVWYNLCIPNMFRPSPLLNDLLKPFLQLFASHFMIGIHIRVGGEQLKWHDRTSFMTERGVARAIALLSNRIRQKKERVRAFVASDSEAILNRFKSLFPGRVISVSSFPLRHVGMNASREGIARCLLDLFLLSRCDELVLTKDSHFSMTAAHLASRRIPVSMLH